MGIPVHIDRALVHVQEIAILILDIDRFGHGIKYAAVTDLRIPDGGFRLLSLLNFLFQGLVNLRIMQKSRCESRVSFCQCQVLIGKISIVADKRHHPKYLVFKSEGCSD